MVINTPGGMIPRRDENQIRSAAYAHSVCIMTTITGRAGGDPGHPGRCAKTCRRETDPAVSRERDRDIGRKKIGSEVGADLRSSKLDWRQLSVSRAGGNNRGTEEQATHESVGRRLGNRHDSPDAESACRS